MKLTLITVLIAVAATGLAACSPDIKPESNAVPSNPVVGATPAEPAATPVAEAGPTMVPAAPEENKGEGAAPAVEAKTDQGEKKSN